MSKFAPISRNTTVSVNNAIGVACGLELADSINRTLVMLNAQTPLVILIK